MTDSLASISFRDETFLMREPLTPSNVLEYFYASQFYSLTGGAKSINEMIRRGSIAPESAGRIDGELYMLVSANKDAEMGMTDMSVFVIQKFKQLVNKPRVPLEIFYVISGTIYLAPGLGKLLERHLETGIEQFEVFERVVKRGVHYRIICQEMEPTTPSSLYGGRSSGSERLSPLNSSFRTFSRNLLGHKDTYVSDRLPAPVALLNYTEQPSADKKSRLLEDKLLRHVSLEDSKFTLLDEQCRNTIDELAVLKDERERLASLKHNQVVHVKAVLSGKIDELVGERRSSSERIDERIHADLKAMEGEVKKLHVMRDDSQKVQAKKIGDEIFRIQAELEKIKALRAQQGERIATILHEEIQKTEHDIMHVKEARNESESEMMKMMEEMCLKIRHEIDNERRLRQYGEEQLLALLEETCNRLEANFQMSRDSC